MNNYNIRIEIEDGEVKQILKELNEAQETIYKCYIKLQSLGVLKIKESPEGTTSDDNQN
ncbi:MAG: hypothetical protein J1E81_07590 [Eubacterium sp.]|nr:hypothetical protein [Eubacterium sp.]